MNLKISVFPLKSPTRALALFVLCSYVLSYLTCMLCSNTWRTNMLACLVSSFVLFALHLKIQILKTFFFFLIYFYWEKYLEPIWTAMMEFLAKIINYICSIVDLRLGYSYVAGIVRLCIFFVYIHLIFINTSFFKSNFKEAEKSIPVK